MSSRKAPTVRIISTYHTSLTDCLAAAPTYKLTAKKEVILSAGSVGSIQILLLSGIGNATELKQLGIKPLVNLPDVGKNLQDHAMLPNQFYISSNDTADERRRDPAVLNAEWKRYNETGQGPLVDTTCNHIGWLRIPDNSSIWDNQTDPSNGPTSGHYELVFEVSVLYLLLT